MTGKTLITRGKVYPEGVEPLRIKKTMAVANDDLTGSPQYRLNICSDGSPSITSVKTGNTWEINWGDLINLAQESGIDRHLKGEEDE